jgi:hypothetical protein
VRRTGEHVACVRLQGERSARAVAGERERGTHLLGDVDLSEFFAGRHREG